MNEIWEKVKGFEKFYEISNLGNVRSLDRVTIVTNRGVSFKKKFKGIKLKTGLDTYGYPSLGLSFDGDRKTVLVHRLVADAFIPNTENKKEVNHINGIKTDNRAENLEWVTASENTRHAFKMGLAKVLKGAENKRTKSISQFTKDGIWVKDWKGGGAELLNAGFDNSNILKTIKGKFKHAYGFIWKFTEK